MQPPTDVGFAGSVSQAYIPTQSVGENYSSLLVAKSLCLVCWPVILVTEGSQSRNEAYQGRESHVTHGSNYLSQKVSTRERGLPSA